MNWDDTGYLISKNKYNENSVIAEVYTFNHGKCSGMVYGGTSRKIRNYLQLGNLIFVSFKSKSENKLGYFNIEIVDSIGPLFFDNKEKMLIMISAINILKIITPELQKNQNIYNLFSKLLNNLKIEKRNSIVDYIYWEIDIIKEIGFDLNLNQSTLKIKNDNHFSEINLDNEIYKIPNFILTRNHNNIENKLIIDALKFISSYLEKKILKPNNIFFPKSRFNLEKFYQ